MSAGRAYVVARWVSVVLHPFAVLAALALVAAWRHEPAAVVRTGVGIGIAMLSMWAFVWHRRRSGRWRTVDASDARERPVLYVVALAVALAYWAWIGGAASPSSRGVLLTVAMLCVAGILNRWIKLSLHMATLAYAAVALLRLWPEAGVAATACVPPLAWARLAMRRHEPGEVIGGTVLGAAAGAVLFAWR
ncbi:hypothetical protein SD81_040175 [Tolypothrix campylonemoides VB511288]|nr:hypothetical protein SD81_040175 [Tolypothrix campylonemoides VB511288]